MSRVTVEAADASRLTASHGGAAGVLSCFGLQQMPEPHVVLADWVRALAPRAPSTPASSMLCKISGVIVGADTEPVSHTGRPVCRHKECILP